MNAEEMQATAELIELALTAYLTAHPTANPERVSAATLIRWVRRTANYQPKKETN